MWTKSRGDDMNPNYKTTGDIEPESPEYPDFPVALSSAIT